MFVVDTEDFAVFAANKYGRAYLKVRQVEQH